MEEILAIRTVQEAFCYLVVIILFNKIKKSKLHQLIQLGFINSYDLTLKNYVKTLISFLYEMNVRTFLHAHFFQFITILWMCECV